MESVVCNFFSLQYRVWSTIVIVHEKSGVFSKYLKEFCLKKIGRNYFSLQKGLMSEHQKNSILRDINYFVEMSVRYQKLV